MRQAPHIYFDPFDPEVGSIVISRSTIDQSPGMLNSYALRSAEIINRVLKSQLGDAFSDQEIDLILNPKNKGHVAAQLERLEASAKGDAVHVNARLLSYGQPDDPVGDVVGIGFMTFEDRRSAQVRKQRPGPPASRNLAVVRGLYVLADRGIDRVNLQHHGIGSSVLHFMLKDLDPRMPVEALDYSDINPALVPVIEGRLGMEQIRTIEGSFAGKPAKQVVWGGRNAGEIVATLEAARPWQAESTQLRRPA